MENKELLKYGILGAIIVAGVIYYMKKQKENESAESKPSDKQSAEPSDSSSNLPYSPPSGGMPPSGQIYQKPPVTKPTQPSGTVTVVRKQEQGKGTKGDTVSYKDTTVTMDSTTLLTGAVKKGTSSSGK